jgi:pimeloyl-ACP methyl ester carboxylesterase
VDDKLIFLTGWSAGGYAVLYTGLRHPDVFRALSVRQGNFDKAFVEPCIPFLDRHQPIQIMYGSEDLLKDQALACTTWLRSHDIDPTILERPGFHRRDPRPVFDFFIEIARNRPWIRISIGDDPNDPMRVTLSVRSSFEAVRYLWDFGDETERSPLSKPVHRYEKPGLYNVQLALWPDQGNPRVRQIQIQIPRARLSSNNPTIPSTQ